MIKKTASQEKHDTLVKELATKINNSKSVKFKSNTSFCLRKKPSEDTNATYIDTSQLNNILDLNIEEKYAVIEPSVTMEQLYDVTSKSDLTIPVISEMKHMTIGGAVIGLWGESSSFNYGLIDETVLEYEAILGNGEIVTVSEKENTDLFMGLPGSYGSICMITKIKIKLIATKPYVQVTYQIFNFIDTYINTVKQLKNIDFVESVYIRQNLILMMTGRYTDDCKAPLIDLHSRFCPTYTSHIYKILKKNKNNTHVEYLKTKDYFFRWDKGAFFVTYKKFGDNLIMKYLLGNKINSKNLYQLAQMKLHNNSNQSKIFQDIIVPTDKLHYFLNWLDKNINIYPLWILPITKKQDNKIFSYQGKINEILINIGVYGRVDTITILPELEKKIQSVGGIKCLYGKNRYSEDTFWDIYNKEKYNGLRNKYHTLNKFTDIYKKIQEPNINLNTKNVSQNFGFKMLDTFYERAWDIIYLITH